MIPICPSPSRYRYRVAGSWGRRRPIGSRGWTSSIRSRISRAGTTFEGSHRFRVPTSMYSMNRKIVSGLRNRSAISRISWSLTSRRMTALIFTGTSPASMAASIPSRTRWRSPRPPEVRVKVSGSRVGRLTVTRSTPASASSSARRGRSIPFVVRARSRIPGISRSISTKRVRSLRIRGSPPVSRIFSTPRETNTRARRVTSS